MVSLMLPSPISIEIFPCCSCVSRCRLYMWMCGYGWIITLPNLSLSKPRST